MNKARRKQISNVIKQLEELQPTIQSLMEELQNIKDEEEEYRDKKNNTCLEVKTFQTHNLKDVIKDEVDCVDAARSIMIDVYGENDLCSPDMVKVKLTFTEEVTSCCQDVSIMGKSISRAYGRDSGATPGQDVVFLKGEPTSGGSARNWDSVVTEGSVVILNHVPKPIYKKYMRHPHEGIEVELLGDETPDRDF